MKSIPNQINIVWLGSFLRSKHQARIIQWKQLNPSHNVNLWIKQDMLDQCTYDKLLSFCIRNNISLREVNDLHIVMNSVVYAWLVRLLSQNVLNFGAITDLYRYYIIKTVGGWYFDTDIEPLLPLPIDLSLPYGFGVNALTDGNQLKYLEPSVIVSSKENSILNAIFLVMHTYSETLGIHYNFAINNSDVLIRMLSTHYTTGNFIRASLSKLTIKSTPLIHFYGPKDETIEDMDVFDKISLTSWGLNKCFEVKGEISWLADENFEIHPGLHNAIGLSDYVTPGKRVFPQVAIDIDAYREKVLESIESHSLLSEVENFVSKPSALEPTSTVNFRFNTLSFYKINESESRAKLFESHLIIAVNTMHTVLFEK